MGTGIEWIAYAAIAASVASAGVSIYGQQQAAKTEERAAEYNANLAEAEARNKELEAAEQHKRQQQAKRKEMARVRNELAATGTLTTTGTPLAILGEASANMDIGIADALRASNMEAASYRSQGQMGLWEASQARTAANISSVATGISGISNAASGYYDFNYKGAFGGSNYRVKKGS